MKAIYSITNIATGKLYIGSSVDVDQRFASHLSKLRKGYHHSRLLQRSFDKHGEQSFKFDIIEELEDVDKQYDREQHWLDHYKSYDPAYGYNIKAKAEPAFHNIGNKYNLGREYSEETKDKISLCHKGRTHSEKSKRNMSKAHLGHKHTTEHNAKFIDSLKASWAKKHAQNKVNEDKAIEMFLNDKTLNVYQIAGNFGFSITWLYGMLKRRGIDTNRPIKAGEVWNKGKKMPPEAIEKMKLASKGVPRRKREGYQVPDSAKEAIRLKMKSLWQDPEYVKMQMERRNKTRLDAKESSKALDTIKD